MVDTNNTETEETPPERSLNEGETVLLYSNDRLEIRAPFGEQVGIVVHGGDVSGRTDTVPMVITNTGDTHRIKARNWEQIDSGKTREAEFLSKPLDEGEIQENENSRYDKVVEHIEESDFDVDLD